MQIKPDASKYFQKIPAALTILSFLFFGFFKLGSTLMNTDAQHWYLRSTNFINAVEKLNFKKTYQDAKPGVPVMWLSGAGMKIMLNLYNSKYGFKPVLYTQETFRLFQISAIGPLVILSFIFLIFYFLLVKKLFNVNTAVFALIFLALHPFYIANARFLHVDAVMTAFASLSFLSFLLFLKEARWRYNIASGILFGLALLTKTQAGFIFPLIIILLTFKYLTEKQKTIIYFSKILFIWTLSSAVAYFAFFPSMWVHPINTVQKVFTEASYVVQTGRKDFGALYIILMFCIGNLGGHLLFFHYRQLFSWYSI